MSTDTSSSTNSEIANATAIRIRGARVHNLRNIDVDLPRDAITVITGVSGSGKSSLAFDTLYAEGQRQYIESLSTYARQFLNQLQRPDVDLVEGLEPTLCIDQRPGLRNPRSTVATITEIYDYLRLMFARAGTAHCPQCGQGIQPQSAEQIIDAIARHSEGTKLMLLSPMVRGRRGAHQDVFAEISKAGFVRVRVDGELYALEDIPSLNIRQNHTIEAVVDRIVWRDEVAERLADSVRTALRFGKGGLVCLSQPTNQTSWDENLFSTRFACPQCEISFPELEPRTFSFNSPYGACPACDGMGRRERFDPELVAPDLHRSPASGAFAAWKSAPTKIRTLLREQIEPFLVKHGGSWDQPLAELNPTGQRRLQLADGQLGPLLEMLEAEWQASPTDKRREILQPLRSTLVCEQCDGSRLRPEALAVTVGGINIHRTTQMSIADALQHFQSLTLTGFAEEVAKPLCEEISKRLGFLQQVGVDYLTLDRSAETLSGGELQRVRLASSIGSGLVGVCYVLDEPSIGLHQQDNDRLIAAMRDLQRAGNTLVVVEHDEGMMRAADWIVDMGPGAGHQGGEILATGTPQQIAKDEDSITGAYLSGRKRVALNPRRRQPHPDAWLTLTNAKTNNLKNVTLKLPLGLMVCVTGVSGSGKSSLINDTLSPAIARKLGLSAAKPGPFESLAGYEAIDKLVAIDQSPIGRSPRSCPATFTGVFDLIRKVFASTREAKQRGFTASRFSFNAGEGRCPQCQGQGEERIEMNFLSDLFVTCSLCSGKRFNQQTLRVRYKHASIADVLAMTVDEAAEFFASFAKIDRFLQSLRSVGLGYLHLGQSSTTLSGGEAQRLKLATELARAESGRTLYLLDEPTTGLHFEDVGRLVNVLDSLVERGNTVLVIEHNLDVAVASDWIIDIGPVGGEGGGYILANGSPEQIAADTKSVTGPYLRPLLSA